MGPELAVRGVLLCAVLQTVAVARVVVGNSLYGYYKRRATELAQHLVAPMEMLP